MRTKFSVVKSARMVRPSGENRAPEGRYEVSNLDQSVPYPIEVILVFETETYNDNVGEVLKQSLEKVLEEYYPLAGRLKMGCDGRMVVDCSGGEGGVLFVEAFSDEEVTVARGDITRVDRDLVSKLVFFNHRPYETILEVPPLTVQVGPPLTVLKMMPECRSSADASIPLSNNLFLDKREKK